MAFTFAAFSYIVALIVDAFLIFFAIFHVSTVLYLTIPISVFWKFCETIAFFTFSTQAFWRKLSRSLRFLPFIKAKSRSKNSWKRWGFFYGWEFSKSQIIIFENQKKFRTDYSLRVIHACQWTQNVTTDVTSILHDEYMFCSGFWGIIFAVPKCSTDSIIYIMYTATRTGQSWAVQDCKFQILTFTFFSEYSIHLPSDQLQKFNWSVKLWMISETLNLLQILYFVFWTVDLFFTFPECSTDFFSRLSHSTSLSLITKTRLICATLWIHW